MQHDSSDRGLSYPIGMPSPALPTVSCRFTKMVIGDGLDEAQRYAETVSARLELAIEAAFAGLRGGANDLVGIGSGRDARPSEKQRQRCGYCATH